MSLRTFGNIAIGLLIPLIAILGVTPFIGHMETLVFGFPILYFWIFLWFPLTSLCLSISWHFFDRHVLK